MVCERLGPRAVELFAGHRLASFAALSDSNLKMNQKEDSLEGFLAGRLAVEAHSVQQVPLLLDLVLRHRRI